MAVKGQMKSILSLCDWRVKFPQGGTDKGDEKMRHGLVGERAGGGGRVNFRDLANKHLRRIFTLFYSQERKKSRATRT